MLTQREEHWAMEIACQALANEDLMDHMTAGEIVQEMANEMARVMSGMVPKFTPKIISRAIELFHDPEFIV